MEILTSKPSLIECQHCMALDDKARGNHSKLKQASALTSCGKVRSLIDSSFKIRKGGWRWRNALHETVQDLDAVRARCFAVSEANRVNKDTGYSSKGIHYPCQEARTEIKDRLEKL